MMCKCHWIVLCAVHFIAFCLGGGRFFPDTVYNPFLLHNALKSAVMLW